MNAYDIQPIGRFASAHAAIKRPVEIACFSYDEEHSFRLDASSLKYYYDPPIGVDLSDGFADFEQLDDSADEHLDALLKTVMELEKKNGVPVDVDVITWRGMMTKILVAPYAKFDGFEMNATCFQCATTHPIEGAKTIADRVTIKGTIFIEESHEYKLRSRAEQVKRPSKQSDMPSQDLMSYWGYKFETLCLLPAPWAETSREYIEERQNMRVRNYAQYCSVVQTSIGGTGLILGGEVDAVWDMKPADCSERINWVELKTSAEIRSDHDAVKFERKLQKFWAQSFLLGVPNIIVGFRTTDAKGTLLRTQTYETTKIPSIVRTQGKNTWDSKICINFTSSFLKFLKDTISEGGVWKIKRDERSQRIAIWKVEETGHGDILTPDFINWRKSIGTQASVTEST